MHTLFGLLVGMAIAGLLAALLTGLRAMGGLGTPSAASAAASAGMDVHGVLGLGGSILVLFTHSMVFVYLIGTGRAIKDASNDYGLDPRYYEEHKLCKWQAAPWATLNTFVIVATAVLGGLVDADGAARWLHPLCALAALLLNALGLPAILRAIRANGLLLDQVVAASWDKNRAVLAAGGDPRPESSLLTAGGWALLLAVSAWLPWLYVRYVMGRSSLGVLPFAAVSALFFVIYLATALRRGRG